MIEYNHKGMTVASLHDERTGSFQYVVVDETTKTAAMVALRIWVIFIGGRLSGFPPAIATRCGA